MMTVSGIKQLADCAEYVSLHTAEATGFDRRYPYEFSYGRGAVKPWCVTHRGAGHYFRTLEGCLAYAAGRGWFQTSMIDTVRAVVELHYRQTFGYDYEGP